jgi:N-glycosylase/DNA lyase
VKLPRYRFPGRAAAMLRQNVEVLYRQERSLSALLLDASDARVARRTLVQLLAGIGPKQASLFLMNVGASDDLAAIDRHLLKYLNLTRRSQAKAPTTIEAYERLEQELRAEANALGVPLSVLDLALWVMMRTLSGGSRSGRNVHSCVA